MSTLKTLLITKLNLDFTCLEFYELLKIIICYYEKLYLGMSINIIEQKHEPK